MTTLFLNLSEFILKMESISIKWKCLWNVELIEDFIYKLRIINKLLLFATWFLFHISLVFHTRQFVGFSSLFFASGLNLHVGNSTMRKLTELNITALTCLYGFVFLWSKKKKRMRTICSEIRLQSLAAQSEKRRGIGRLWGQSPIKRWVLHSYYPYPANTYIYTYSYTHVYFQICQKV